MAKNIFDKLWYIERNKQVAMELYGDRLNANREVAGTDIYFDECWRMCAK